MGGNAGGDTEAGTVGCKPRKRTSDSRRPPHEPRSKKHAGSDEEGILSSSPACDDRCDSYSSEEDSNASSSSSSEVSGEERPNEGDRYSQQSCEGLVNVNGHPASDASRQSDEANDSSKGSSSSK